MNPGTYTLDLIQGDTARWQFVLWLDADRTQPVNLEDKRVEAMIRDRNGTTLDMLVAVTLPNIVLVTLPAAMSELVGPRCGWALKLRNRDNEVHTILRGQVRANASILA
jgi:hypothetical protein